LYSQFTVTSNRNRPWLWQTENLGKVWVN
jgi:hypothetical protein